MVWDLSAHGGGKESLPKTRRPGFVSTVRRDLPNQLMGLKKRIRGTSSSRAECGGTVVGLFAAECMAKTEA
jgi:hypothetical protein